MSFNLFYFENGIFYEKRQGETKFVILMISSYLAGEMHMYTQLHLYMI